MDTPIPGRCGAKLRGKDRYCRKYPVEGGKRCELHGGAGQRGIANPNFKTGQYSKHLPTRLLSTYQQAVTDPDLLNLSSEIALLKSRLVDVLSRVDTGESGRLWSELKQTYRDIQQAQRERDAAKVIALMDDLGTLITRGQADWAAWSSALEITERIGKMSEREMKRRTAMQAMITSEEAMTLVVALQDAVRRHVDDPDTLTAISAEFVRLTARPDRDGAAALGG